METTILFASNLKTIAGTVTEESNDYFATTRPEKSNEDLAIHYWALKKVKIISPLVNVPTKNEHELITLFPTKKNCYDQHQITIKSLLRYTVRRDVANL
jgi:hypothetical protein